MGCLSDDVVTNLSGTHMQMRGHIVDPVDTVFKDNADAYLRYSRPRVFCTKHDITTMQPAGRHFAFARNDNKGDYPYVAIPSCGDEPIADEVECASSRGTFKLHADVIAGQLTLGTFTTPAPDKKGRAMPPGRRENDFPDQVIRRWRSDGCNFAPWQYQPWNLMWRTNTKKGVLECDTLNAEMRERVHLYPVGATAKSSQNLSGKHVEIVDTPYRVRLRLIGNSWHLGVTAFLLQKYIDRLASFRQAGCDRTGPGRQSAPPTNKVGPPLSAVGGRGSWSARCLAITANKSQRRR